MKIDFYLRFHTRFGQTIAVVGDIPALGSNEPVKALPLDFLSDEYWHTSVEIDSHGMDCLNYRYIFTDANGERRKEAEKNRIIDLKPGSRDIVAIDTWNDESQYENAFYTTPF